MRRIAWILIPLLLAGACRTVSDHRVAFEDDEDLDRYRFELSFERGANGTITGSATVVDREAEASMQIPLFSVPAGERATFTASDEVSRATLELEVTADAAGGRATYQIRVMKDGDLIASESDSVAVR